MKAIHLPSGRRSRLAIIFVAVFIIISFLLVAASGVGIVTRSVSVADEGRRTAGSALPSPS